MPTATRGLLARRPSLAARCEAAERRSADVCACGARAQQGGSCRAIVWSAVPSPLVVTHASYLSSPLSALYRFWQASREFFVPGAANRFGHMAQSLLNHCTGPLLPLRYGCSPPPPSCLRVPLAALDGLLCLCRPDQGGCPQVHCIPRREDRPGHAGYCGHPAFEECIDELHQRLLDLPRRKIGCSAKGADVPPSERDWFRHATEVPAGTCDRYGGARGARRQRTLLFFVADVGGTGREGTLPLGAAS